jgi:hypothetical protein
MNNTAPVRNNKAERAYCFFEIKFFIFLKNTADENKVSSQITNPEANGYVAVIHGYAALLGLGMTLTRNQIKEDNPINGRIRL